MPTTLSIGQFSRVTHLSVKALRHYHDVGLLKPAEVDTSSGYRYYTTGQVPTAHLIKRFRDLEMPIDRVKAVLAASDQDDQHRLISTRPRRRADGPTDRSRRLGSAPIRVAASVSHERIMRQAIRLTH